ncbi:hypothetical protein SPRG_17849 [Saprolegnia parasitica CBS 223.65]|uniref:Uncharacterized protein n=1 Tax=Saprolegnia parasitica (strain CBS 223.65) TaxID=695850 RepID=A0A067BIT4_SAPPC|nr:hypothetical protein SPRG_17849 [Saprolegnia parasitica CBS 223.65]KDO16655.1 hypothetical protein SPRG_17849 [Saprolegnia parasitica CBS 223.65]|eukprot:XP_012212637.1 hypothetical protein SPRG_17849 [Saprolegnia parasitica CBS 223.65]
MRNGALYTHVCTLCTRSFAAKNGTHNAWREGLYRMANTSNAKDHVMRKHKSHPIAIAMAKKTTGRVNGDLQAFDTAQAVDAHAPNATQAPAQGMKFLPHGR